MKGPEILVREIKSFTEGDIEGTFIERKYDFVLSF